MNQFYLDHGKPVVVSILIGMPEDATHFVYAYVAKSIEYIKYDGVSTFVWYQGKWKEITAQFVIDSFKDLMYSLAELREVARCYDLVDTHGGLDGARSRLKYYREVPNSIFEYQVLKRAIRAVERKRDPIVLLKGVS